jgi:hypothetical protein
VQSLRVCSSCKELVPVSRFGKDKRQKSGLKSACQPCCNAAVRKWRINNPEKAREASAKYHSANPEKRRASSRKWYNENKELAQRNAKEWRESNRDWVNEYGREYARKWRAANPEKAKESARRGSKKRREHPIRRLEDAIKNGIYRGIRGITKDGHTFDLLGYSLEELTAHLEPMFSDGMSWENYGEWHVDHIRPLASYSYKSTNEPEFKEAWALSNLQPLWGSENQSKGAKLTPANDNVPSSSQSESA